jgi:hypothetical protein
MSSRDLAASDSCSSIAAAGGGSSCAGRLGAYRNDRQRAEARLRVSLVAEHGAAAVAWRPGFGICRRRFGSNTVWIDPDHDLVVVWRWHDGNGVEFFKRIVDSVKAAGLDTWVGRRVSNGQRQSSSREEHLMFRDQVLWAVGAIGVAAVPVQLPRPCGAVECRARSPRRKLW